MDDAVPYGLILRSLQGELSDLEAKQLQRWLETSSENARIYRETAAVWALQPTVTSGLPMRADAVAEVLRRVRSPVDASDRATDRLSVAAIRARAWMGWAAAVAATVLLGWGFSRQLDRTASSEKAGAGTVFVTRADETATARLPDGSYVQLAPGSRLQAFAHPGDRTVWLEGRAFFAVTHDPAHPFVVRTPAGDAAVLGTRFDLRADSLNLELVVVEGRVELSAGRGKVEVGQGEVSRARKGETPSVEKVKDVYALLALPQGVLMFQNTPLRQAARDIELRFGVRFRFADSIGPGRKVSAVFADESFDEVLTSVCRATRVGCVVRGDSVIVTR